MDVAGCAITPSPFVGDPGRIVLQGFRVDGLFPGNVYVNPP